MGRRNKREKVYSIRFKRNGLSVTASVIAVNQKQAERLAGAFPRVERVFKTQGVYDRMMNRELTDLTTNLMKDIAKPTIQPLALDEFLWQRKSKRKDNIANKEKDRLDN